MTLLATWNKPWKCCKKIVSYLCKGLCARWVPKEFTSVHKQAHLKAFSEFIDCHASDETFNKCLVTDVILVHYHMPKSREHPWNGIILATREQKNCIMATVFWDVDRVILEDCMHKGTSINSGAYVDTLHKLKD